MFLTQRFLNHSTKNILHMSARRSSDYGKFKQLFDSSKRIVVLTGAGVSAESGVPTFRGDGGLWRKYRATDLATPQAFRRDASLVWQFYEYRRQLVATKTPNNAHKTLAALEKQFQGTDRSISIVTQNVDELHRRAGSADVVELHGTLYKTRCTKCHRVEVNTQNPIVEALSNISSLEDDNRQVSLDDLPHCTSCNGLLRPHIVWFNESLAEEDLEAANTRIDACDLLLVIGTSSCVYPAAMFAPAASARGVPIAEFNIEPTLDGRTQGFFFEGPCGTTLPRACGLSIDSDDAEVCMLKK